MSQWSKKIFEMCMAVVLDVGIARGSLKYWSVSTNMYWLTCVVLGNGFTKLNTAKSNSPDAGKSCNLRQWRYLGLFLGRFGECWWCGRRMQPWLVRKCCDVVCCTCVGDRDVQHLERYLIPLVCVDEAMGGLQPVWRRWKLIVVRAAHRSWYWTRF